MAIPLLSDVQGLVRSRLGDTVVAAGQLYTAAFQLPHNNSAYQELFSRLSIGSAARVQREVYFNLQTGQTVLYPSSMGVANFGNPVEMWERGSLSSWAVAGATVGTGTPATNVDIQITPNSVGDLVANGLVINSNYLMEINSVGGLSDDVNDQYGVLIVDATHIRLLGCAATGTWTSGGTVFYSPEQEWNGPVYQKDDTNDFPGSPNSEIEMFTFQRGVLKFPPTTQQREIKLRYTLSGAIPSTATGTYSMGIDDSLNFLASRSAQYCAKAKGNIPAMQAEQQAAQYFLGLMLTGAARQLQTSDPIVPAPFREKRNIRPFSY